MASSSQSGSESLSLSSFSAWHAGGAQGAADPATGREYEHRTPWDERERRAKTDELARLHTNGGYKKRQQRKREI